MQVENNILLNQESELTISQEIVYLINSLPQKVIGNFQKENFLLGVLGSSLADLFLMHKIELEANYIKINNYNRTGCEYLDEFLSNLLTIPGNKTILNVLMDYPQNVLQLEDQIKESLVLKGLLPKKHHGFLFFKPKDDNIGDDYYLKGFISRIKEELITARDIPQTTMFLVIILQGIELLPYMFGSKEELNTAEQKIQQQLNNDKTASRLLRGFENIKKLRDAKSMVKRQTSRRGFM